MIVWINGAFSVGKTTVARELARRWPAAVLLDPEQIGFLLRRLVPVEAQTGDFQDLRLWRQFTVEACAGLMELTGRPLIVPMTLIDENYFDEIVGGLKQRGMIVHHFALIASPATLRKRIRFRLSFPGDKKWARRHIDKACQALAKPRFAVQVNTDDLKPSAVADRILEKLPHPLPQANTKS